MNNTQNAALRAFSELTADQIRQACEITEPSHLITDSGTEIEVDPLDNGKLEFKEPESGDIININPEDASISEVISNEQSLDNAEGEQADPFDPSGEEVELYADEDAEGITDDEIADLSDDINESDEEAQEDDEDEAIVDKFYSDIDGQTYYVSNYGRCFSESGEEQRNFAGFLVPLARMAGQAILGEVVGNAINKTIDNNNFSEEDSEDIENENMDREQIVGSQTYYFSNYGRCFSEDGNEICINPDDNDYDGLDTVDEGEGLDDDDAIEIVKDFSDPITGETFYFSSDGRCFSEDGEEVDLNDDDEEGSDEQDDDEIVDHYEDEETGKTYYFSRCGRCFSEDGEEIDLEGADDEADEDAPAEDGEEDDDEIVGSAEAEDGKTYYFSRCGRCFSEDGEEVEPEFSEEGDETTEGGEDAPADGEEGEQAATADEESAEGEGEEDVKSFSASESANEHEVFKIY